jgi:hypothetical protein
VVLEKYRKYTLAQDSFYEELRCVFDQFPRNDMKIFWLISTQGKKEDIFKLTIGNESSHEISNDNGIKSSKLCNT